MKNEKQGAVREGQPFLVFEVCLVDEWNIYPQKQS